jgi:uncharacterized protein YndB with AHSA1/START domain
MRKTITDQAIRLSAAIALPPARLWPLLTQNAHIANWWGGYVTLAPAIGGTLREVWSNGAREVVTAGEVIEIAPPHLLLLSWADDDWPGWTKLRIEIVESPDGSVVELDHTGWDIHPPATRSRLIADHAAGWEGHLRSFKFYAERQMHLA